MMPAEQPIAGAYFDTPARAERLQLLLHLLRNAGEVIYLRAPAGAGKTRFVHRLLDDLGEEMATAWVRAGRDCDLPAAVVVQLGRESTDIIQWPESALEAAGERDFLLIVDDADKLDPSAVEDLTALHVRGARLLLLGHGGLAHATRSWNAQFVDLPSFDARQSTAFLHIQAGAEAARITEDFAAALHRAAHGLPGPLLDGLHEVLSRARKKTPVNRTLAGGPGAGGRPLWHWLGGGLALVILAAVLVFQDRINVLFSPEPGQVDRQAAVMEPANTGAVVPPGRGGLADGDELRAEAVTALMPKISLPELSGTPSERGATVPTPVFADVPPTPAEPVEDRQREAPVQRVQSPEGARRDYAAGEDPLDAVMQDALAAAEADSRPVSVPSSDVGPAVASGHESVKNAASGKEEEKPDQPVDAAAVVAESKDEIATVAPVKPAPVDKVAEAVESAVVPAPVESRTPEPRAKSPATAKPAVAPAPAVVAKEDTEPGDGWLKSRKPGHYTLQLVGARDRTAVDKFVRDNAIRQPYAIFARDLDGRPWYSLVAGDFRDRDTAIAARGRLSKSLQRSGVWPRTFASIQKIK